MAPNHLQRQFDVQEPNRVWVTDITYIRTLTKAGFIWPLYWTFFSRQVVGWSMSSRIDRKLAMNALLMAVWRRQPKNRVMMHSKQGSQFSSYDWRDFLDQHNLQQSMSRRGNCHGNAVAESFFQLLNGNESNARHTALRKKQGVMSSITSRCFTIQSAGAASAMTCRRSNMKSSISSGSRVYRKLVAIQIGWPVRGPGGEPQSYLLGRPQMQKAHRNGGPFCSTSAGFTAGRYSTA